MPRRVEEHPILIAQTGPLKGQRFVLDRALVIGREASCDVTIPDRQVSRYHARVTPEAQGVTLEDLGSKNGTHRNGESVSGTVDLKDGDMVQIALIQSFMFLTSDATLPLTEELTRPGRLRLDTRSRGVWVNDQSIEPPLSALQFHVLNVLYENGGQVVERAKLVSEAWGDEEAVGVSDEALDALLRRLRERIAAVDSTHNYIVTVRGHGVRLDNPPVE
jgi:pSer/pThr/pTyr-binding forkhead associated (FHA) protein